MKRALAIFLFSLAFIPAITLAQESNAGFVPSNIWYSKDPFTEGDKIKIYTLIFNPESAQMSGSVSFFDKNVLLGKKDFTVPANGVRDVSVEWTATAGSHVIFGRIENARFLVSGKYEAARLDRTVTEESRRTVSKKVIESKEDTTSDSVPQTDKFIQNLILENTPEFIANPVISAANGIENFRQNRADSGSKYSLPFKNRYVFYGTSLLIVFFIIRFVWRRVF